MSSEIPEGTLSVILKAVIQEAGGEVVFRHRVLLDMVKDTRGFVITQDDTLIRVELKSEDQS